MMWLSSTPTRWPQTCSLFSVQVPSVAQTEGSGQQQPSQPASSSQASAAIQTVSQDEQDLVLAHQGRFPVSKDVYGMCKGITQLLQGATEKARGGHIGAAEEEVFRVRH